ncbi:hypothetical protein [Streptomyces cyanogenus]|uniref:Uncharacterized protein n=1 Tax=Streptomyces cyanogenus TaxID=80860 RepID=A0ABX7U3N2_STRCY|nr:hypothetical protein [Streptomyces cyanogenus]QTE02469.1 hypothetical protein S1361_34380 [Streptomyces cyanogenus]
MKTPYDVVIVGAGVAGALCACQVQQAPGIAPSYGDQLVRNAVDGVPSRAFPSPR